MNYTDQIEKEAEEVANALKVDMVMVDGKAYYAKESVINAMKIKSKYDMDWFKIVVSA